MHEHQLAETGGVKSGLLQPTEETRQRKHKVQPARLRGSSTMVRTACRLGDRSCARAHATRLNRATLSRFSGARYSLLHLQRHYGNRFVQRIMAMRRKASVESEAQPDIEHMIQSSRGGGQQLDKGVRSQMESSFGSDFSGVRVHNDTRADDLNQALSARAFTTGQDIFFRRGNYDPGSSNGRELLAHELTHVVQQNQDEIQPKLTIGQPGDRYEQEADSVARAIMQQELHSSAQGQDKAGVRRRSQEAESLRLQPVEEEEEALQTRLQRQEEEEELQTKIQRQEEEEEELQTKVQRQEEEELQPKI